MSVYNTRAWTYSPIRQQCYLHQFNKEQPDLNYENKDVYDGMMEILEYWLKQGADGFRMHFINHLFEAEGLPDEPYYNPNGDRESYSNLFHNATMNQVII